MDQPWYALAVHSATEATVAAWLDQVGIEYFYPSYADKRRYSDRIKVVQRPLFPGYLFARLSQRERYFVTANVHVQQILGAGSKPLPVPDDVIETIRLMVASGKATPIGARQIRVGDRVIIRSGKFKGFEGRLLREGSAQRLVVEIEALHRSVSLELQPDVLLRKVA